MRSIMTNSLLVSTLLVLPLFFLWGCDNDTSNGDIEGGGPEMTDQTCIGCHSSRDNLEEALAKTGGSKVMVAHKDDG